MANQRRQDREQEESGAHVLAVLRQVEEDERDPGFYVSKTWLACAPLTPSTWVVAIYEAGGGNDLFGGIHGSN